MVIERNIFDVFDSINALLREAFLHTHPKKWIKQSLKSIIVFPECFDIFIAFGLTVFGFLYAHYTNKKNYKKVVIFV